MRLMTFILLGLYILVMIVIGIVGGKRAKELDGFALANSSVGALLAGLSIFASWMSASTFMGVPAFFYQWGWSSFALAISVTFAAPVALILTIKRIGSQTRKLKANTFTDFISLRYDSVFIKVLVSLLAVNLYITTMIAQLKAVGLIFETSIGIEYWQAVVLGVVITAFYILFGGMWASLVTDGVQAVVMIITALVLIVSGFWAVGGINGLYEGLLSLGDNLVAYTEPTFWTPITVLIQPIYWGLLIFAFPYVMNRTMVLKNEKEYKKFISVFWICNTLGIGFMIVGGFSRVLLPNLEQADLAVIQLAANVLPSIIASITLLGIFLASMSSIDSVLHAAGTLIGNDVYRGLLIPALGKDKDDEKVKKTSILISQIFIIIFTIIPVYFALFNPPELLALFLYWGTGLMASGTVALLLIGIFWKDATKYGAIFGGIIGPISYICIDQFLDINTYINAPISIAISGLVLVIVSLVENKLSSEPSVPAVTKDLFKAS